MNFVKFLRTPFLQNTSGRLLLTFVSICLCSANANQRNRGKLKSFFIYLAQDNLALESSEKLNFCFIYRTKSNFFPISIFVTFKFEKQSCGCFFYWKLFLLTLRKFLGQRVSLVALQLQLSQIKYTKNSVDKIKGFDYQFNLLRTVNSAISLFLIDFAVSIFILRFWHFF